ncbi:MAG: hypothetical protein SPI83_06420 [Rothia sp. (in: high G+C Gram-positive bacteria)]|nr:hypothetical protein [Rothia sp. (in: high G+C Gram-positive bacteria)]
MSENVDSQVEEVSPEVYRRRRIVALLVLVLALLLIIGLISWLAGRGNNTDTATATASTSASVEAFSDFSQRATESAAPSESAQPSESASASESAEPSAEPTPSESTLATVSAEPTESAEPTPSASATEQALVTACTAADLQVNLTADRTSYAAGQNPALAVTYTNTSGNPCIVTGGANNVDVNITSGPAQVYNYAQCNANPVADAEVAAGATNTTALTWNRSLNALGCNSAATIKPGHYWATATVNGVPSKPVRIVVTG